MRESEKGLQWQTIKVSLNVERRVLSLLAFAFPRPLSSKFSRVQYQRASCTLSQKSQGHYSPLWRKKEGQQTLLWPSRNCCPLQAAFSGGVYLPQTRPWRPRERPPPHALLSLSSASKAARQALLAQIAEWYKSIGSLQGQTTLVVGIEGVCSRARSTERRRVRDRRAVTALAKPMVVRLLSFREIFRELLQNCICVASIICIDRFLLKREPGLSSRGRKVNFLALEHHVSAPRF